MRRHSAVTRIRQLVDALRVYEPERVYLFGSAAFDEADEVSDLDVVVIKQTEASFFDRLSEVAGLLPGGMGAIDILVLHARGIRGHAAGGERICRDGGGGGAPDLWRAGASLKPAAGFSRPPTT